MTIHIDLKNTALNVFWKVRLSEYMRSVSVRLFLSFLLEHSSCTYINTHSSSDPAHIYIVWSSGKGQYFPQGHQILYVCVYVCVKGLVCHPKGLRAQQMQLESVCPQDAGPVMGH